MAKLCKFFSNDKKKYETQKRNRCKVCARARGFIGLFSMCRICVRKILRNCNVPGFVKDSW